MGIIEFVFLFLSSILFIIVVVIMFVVFFVVSLVFLGEVLFCLEEVVFFVSGICKVWVFYDYEVVDSSELVLLVDEFIIVYSLFGMDFDWFIGERGNKKGKVFVIYLELFS